LVGGRESAPYDEIPERFPALESGFGARRGLRPAAPNRDQQRLARIERTGFERLDADLKFEPREFGTSLEVGDARLELEVSARLVPNSRGVRSLSSASNCCGPGCGRSAIPNSAPAAALKYSSEPERWSTISSASPLRPSAVSGGNRPRRLVVIALLVS
jgi:hypothetical protein